MDWHRSPSWKLVLLALCAVLISSGCFLGLANARQQIVRDIAQGRGTIYPIDTVSRQMITKTVTVEGRLDAAVRGVAAFNVPGMIVQIAVRVGQQVRQGDPLGGLDARDLDLEVQRARSALEIATATYSQTVATSSPEQLAQAEVVVTQSHVGVEQAQRQRSDLDMRAAQLRVEAAQAALDRALAGASVSELRDAQAKADQARTTLNQTNIQAERQRTLASRAKTDAELALAQSANAVRQAQTAYSTAFWQNDYAQQTGFDPVAQNPPPPGAVPLNTFERQRYKDVLTQAELTLHNAEGAMEQARVAYEQVRQSEVQQAQQSDLDLQATNQQLLLAEAAIADLKQPLPKDEVATRQLALAQAQADLQRLKSLMQGSDIAAATAALTAAQARKTALLAGPSSTEVLKARAQLEQSRLQLDQARGMLAEATLRAPLSGTVIEIKQRPGDLVAKGTPIIMIADLTTMTLKGAVEETDVIKLRSGQAATITVDVAPEAAATGFVAELAQVAQAAGDRTQAQSAPQFAIEVRITNPLAIMRIGMTASGVIVVQQRDHVLAIPPRGLRQEGAAWFVDRVLPSVAAPENPLDPPSVERVPVTVGLQTETWVEIVGGLQEQDRVLGIEVNFGP